MKIATRWLKLLVISGWLLCPMALNAAVNNQIKSLRVQTSVGHCRLIFTSARLVSYRSFTLAHPHRLVIDFTHVPITRFPSYHVQACTAITDMRSGVHKNNQLRIVFDLKNKVLIHAFALAPSNHNSYHRIVIDLTHPPVKTPATTFVASAKKIPPHKASSTRYLAAATVVIQQSSLAMVRKRPRNIIVIIDPGHGGKDPGATGLAGTHEKNVVLKIARALQHDINRQPGFSAYLTRTSDHYLTLRQRLAIARRYKADMFIAIHADAYRNHIARGASVFALSRRGATSEATRWLAQRENESELMGGVELNNKTNLLRSVLINLSQTATIRASLRIGYAIIHTLGHVVPLHQQPVEQAAFVVLKSPDIPSLLVETGFISNPQEEMALRHAHYQQRLASAIMHGICSYFIHAPPRGTWLAVQKFKPTTVLHHYVVAHGDTLNSIARKFSVSLAALKSLNKMNHDRLQTGQILIVPPVDDSV